MIDTYSKIILTVIAGALVAIFAQQMVQSASAQFGIALGCDRQPRCAVLHSPHELNGSAARRIISQLPA